MLESQFEIYLVYNLEDHQLMRYEFFGKPDKRTGLGPSGKSIVLISRVMAFFSYKVSKTLSTNLFSLTIKLQSLFSGTNNI